CHRDGRERPGGAARGGDRPARGSPLMALLGAAPRVVNVGLDLFALTLAALDVPAVHVDWRPPAGGDPRLAALLARLDARRAAILGAIRYEGWAANDDAARELVERGAVRLEPCHHHATAGPMAGVVTPSMPVFVVENRAHGTRGHATINEGLGKVLRYGANDDSVLARLNWIATEAGPLLGAGLRALGGIDLRALMAQALRMGDEMHQRNLAATALFTRALMPGIAQVGGRHHAVARLAEFLAGNDQFFLNIAMAAGKSMVEPVGGVAGSTLV